MSYTTTTECIWIAIHLLGLTTSWLVRIDAQGRSGRWTFGLFYLSLAAVGLLTVIGHLCFWPLWTLSAGILTVMIVTSVADFGSPNTSAAMLESS